REFFESAKRITPRKPIIAFKGGTTAAGARAARSHSGAMAGVKELYQAAFRQAGVLWAYNTEEMLEWAAAFSSLPLPKGNRVGILTRGGGWGVITADACNELGLEVPSLDEEVAKELDAILPQFWSRGNPVDMVATIGVEPYVRGLEILISWDRVDAVISLSGQAGPLTNIISDVKKRGEPLFEAEKIERLSQQVAEGRTRIFDRGCELIRKYRKPIFAVGRNAGRAIPGAQPDFSLAHFRTPERAVHAAAALCRYAAYRKSIQKTG
ncbi:MAG TPA: CoA-binding protein, partial [Thermodesulfobacteriota bacterium]|nr:CoA-binding protein [Thermodesulfobacteriota bacterium]